MGVHIYLSPHLDDAVFSCGGLIARQVASGDEVTVLTVCAGEPDSATPLSPLAQEFHTRWGVPVSAVGTRRSEDRMACGRLGALVVHGRLPDAIYRRSPEGGWLYQKEEALLASLHPSESRAIEDIAAWLSEGCPPEATLYCPLAIGGHVDHRLTRAAAERARRSLHYYQDFPYAARGGLIPGDLSLPGREEILPLSAEEIQAWAAGVAEYASQLSTFWQDDYTLYEELRAFHDDAGGIVLRVP